MADYRCPNCGGLNGQHSGMDECPPDPPDVRAKKSYADREAAIEGTVLELGGEEWRVIEVRFSSIPSVETAPMHLTLLPKKPEPPLDPWTVEMREVRPEFCWRLIGEGVACIKDIDHEGECG